MSEYICRIKDIVKEFPGVKALKGVSFDVRRGEIHAIIGENGAGKSTLMNVLAGVGLQTSGEIEFDDKKVHFAEPSDAQAAGVGMIYQELSLSNYMTVAENIFQGRMPTNKMGFIDFKKMNALSRDILKRLGVDYINPAAQVKTLSVSQRQLVEIAKALSLNAKLLIMDEPTAALTEGEIKIVLDIMRSLREEGMSILFITHKLEEVLDVADRITVLRDGEYIKTMDAKDTTLQEMISLMVGRSMEVVSRDFAKDIDGREVVLKVENLSVPGRVKNVSFELHRGEVLGLTGLVGAGRSELLEAVFGREKISSGEIYVGGKKVHFKGTIDAIRAGIGLVPEDRKGQGLFLKMPVSDNMTIVHAREINKGRPLMDSKKTAGLAEEYVQKLRIKTPNITTQVQNLSGGNQQKTIIARWMMHNPQILMMDEPTHGIDVGAKAEIYELIDRIAKTGVSIILLSSELPEVIRMSDRIMVMHHGELRGILNHDEATQVAIMSYTLEAEEDRAAIG